MPFRTKQRSTTISARTADKVNKWGYRLAAVYGLLHLCTVVLHNVGHLSDGYGDFSSLESLQQRKWIRYYAQFAGIHGGYGFYGPQVGSSYHSRFTLINTTSSSEGQRSYHTPGLSSIATLIRYRSLLEARDGWFTPSGEVNPLAKALILSLCRHQSHVYSGRGICCSYMALSVPKLRDFKQGKPIRTTYIVLYAQEYTAE